MKAVDSNLQLKKPKYCYTCSMLLTACLLGHVGVAELWAAEIASPPAEGSHTRDELAKPEKQPPALPSDAQDSDDSRKLPQPEVNIIHEKDKTIEEYRVGGKLRYIKITPSHGPAYYLVDRNGDGIMERYSLQNGPPPINQWLLLEW